MGSTAAKMPVKFQSDHPILITKLTAGGFVGPYSKMPYRMLKWDPGLVLIDEQNLAITIPADVPISLSQYFITVVP